MILILDNFDSFTFNLVHLVRRMGEEVVVVRSDEESVDLVLARKPSGIVISPGPGRPGDRGIAIDLIRASAGRFPLLGVCLGHQAIAAGFGGRIVHGTSAVHGKVSFVEHRGTGVFSGVPRRLPAMRYHSLVVDPQMIPPVLEVTAWLAGDPATVMGIRHREFPIHGIQFHPESFLTPHGPELIRNFLRMCAEAGA